MTLKASKLNIYVKEPSLSLNCNMWQLLFFPYKHTCTCSKEKVIKLLGKGSCLRFALYCLVVVQSREGGEEG